MPKPQEASLSSRFAAKAMPESEARSTTCESPPPYTDELTNALQTLKALIKSLHIARSAAPPDPVLVSSLESQIHTIMVQISEIHPDARVRADYASNAEKFKKAKESKEEAVKGGVLNDIAMGLGVVLAAPLALVGGVFLFGGAVIEGTGSALRGLGTMLTDPVLNLMGSKE